MAKSTSSPVTAPQKPQNGTALTGYVIDMAFLLLVNQMIKYFNLGDAKYLMAIRIGFAIVQALSVSILLFVKSRIDAVDNKETVEIVEPKAEGAPATAELKKKRITAAEYDRQELNKQLRGCVQSVVFNLAIHWFFKSPHMLLVSTANGFKSVLMSPLVKIYVYAVKSLTRPFPDPSSVFSELLKSFEEHGKDATPSVASKKTASLSDTSDDEHPLVKSLETPKIKIASGEESGNVSDASAKASPAKSSSASASNTRNRKK